VPGNHEMLARASGYAATNILDDTPWEDGSIFSDLDRRSVTNLGDYIREYNSRRSVKQNTAQRRAMVLLRSLLTPAQRKTLQTHKEFLVICPSGNVYRLYPRNGMVWRVERHGKNWFAKSSYCIHEAKETGIPPADRTIAHMLMLMTDEEEFLRTANATRTATQMWNSEYLRAMRRRNLPDTAAMTSPQP